MSDGSPRTKEARGAWMARRRNEAVSHDPRARYSELKPTKLDHGQPGCRADRRLGIRQTEPSPTTASGRVFHSRPASVICKPDPQASNESCRVLRVSTDRYDPSLLLTQLARAIRLIRATDSGTADVGRVNTRRSPRSPARRAWRRADSRARACSTASWCRSRPRAGREPRAGGSSAP